ncbi:MAG: TetR/AcrR family transcriptional regulator [Pirellulaceae bacterium]|nr:TetR/AcrR family transcriptional regulator [Pirellulaceae bacterium]
MKSDNCEAVPRTLACEAARNQLLDAVEELVNAQGVGRFTLEAVAKQAGLSKSGLLHYFPSKDSLIEALVARTVAHWQDSLEQAKQLQSEGPHRTAHALLDCCLGDLSQWNERLRRSSTALLAILVHCPGKATPMHVFYQGLHAQMQAESKDLPVSDLVLAVVDGVWVRWVTGLSPMSETQIAQLHGALKRLLPYCG